MTSPSMNYTSFLPDQAVDRAPDCLHGQPIRRGTLARDVVDPYARTNVQISTGNVVGNCAGLTGSAGSGRSRIQACAQDTLY
jgi:hypothetical protein